MNKGATISDDKKYRYSLYRIWDDELPKVAIVGLNPSTADENFDDPTIKRCIEFVKNWGYGGFYMLNLFAYRATDPNELSKVNDPVGKDNEKFILETISKVDKVICAWGNGGNYLNQNIKILSLINSPYCLKINQSGEPSHPLYLRRDLRPIAFVMPNIEKEVSKNIEPEKNIENNSTDTNLIIEGSIIDGNPFETYETKNTKNISIKRNIEKGKLQPHIQVNFSENETLITRVVINDGEMIFKCEDTIYIGTENIFWTYSGVGEYYVKSNDEIDAEHISEEFKIKTDEIDYWKAICIKNHIFLELQTKSQKFYRTVSFNINEIENLLRLQLELNRK
jgi:hypothetical protein